MSLEFTPVQALAVHDTKGGLLVSAAAGSGKTAVLVERVACLLADKEHPITPDRLLIVTFTNAAAAQLRRRIGARLAALCAQNPADAYLRKQKMLLGTAHICTIDAFCLQLLQRHFNQIEGLAPDLAPGDEAGLFALRRNALAQTLEEMYADSDFCAFASLYGRARSDNAAGEAVLQLYDTVRSMPWPMQRLQELTRAYDEQAALCESEWGKTLLAYAEELLQSALRMARRAVNLAQSDADMAGYLPALQSDEAFIVNLQSSLQKASWDEAYLRLQAYSPQTLGRVRGGSDALKDDIKGLRDEVKTLLRETLRDRVFICTQQEYQEDMRRAAPMVRALVRAVQRFNDIFYAARMEEKALDFSDFEHLTLQMLMQPDGTRTALAHSLSSRFAAVMVDEYQDTNLLQEQLYACLAHENGDNLFCVGDLKQSIYRFRQADPSIFLHKKQSYAHHDGAHYPAVISLEHNFRSAGNVVKQVNYIFSLLMRPCLGGIDYADGEALQQGTKDEYDGGALEMLLTDTAQQGLQADAAAVAEKINEMVQSGFTVRDANGGQRACGYGDFCILLRTRGAFALYQNTLQQAGIPAFADTAESWLAAPEVSVLLSLLRAVDNPLQEIHLAAAMLSPLYGIAPDTLAQLRAQHRSGSFYAAVMQGAQPQVQRFAADLARFRTLAATLSVRDLCAEIITHTHAQTLAGAMPQGAQKRENLQRFLSYAEACSAKGSGTLAGFLRMADAQLERGAQSAASAPQCPPDTVGIMTVHRSKGLEFPIVIVADAAHAFNFADLRSQVLVQPQQGLGLCLRCGTGDVYPSLPHRALSLQLRRESVAEELRTLYVALTRAQDKLIISLAMRDAPKRLTDAARRLQAEQGISDEMLTGASHWGDWLLAAALLHPQAEEWRKAAGAAVLPLQSTDAQLQAVLTQPQAAEPAVRESYRITAAPDEALARQLSEGFDWRYPREAYTQLPVKRSVSAVAHADAEPVLQRPSFMYAEGLTAAERGTALHAFMQFANLRAAAQNPAAERDRLVEQGFLSAQVAQQLPLDDIAHFFTTDLARRIALADEVLRETDFITAVPASAVQPGAAEGQTVLVQGIADMVLLRKTEMELIDYKTDAHKTPQQFIDAYAPQLALYKAALQKRFGLPVVRCSLYAFALGREIELPL